MCGHAMARMPLLALPRRHAVIDPYTLHAPPTSYVTFMTTPGSHNDTCESEH